MSCVWLQIAQSFTQRPVKGMLTGPVTILNWSFPRKDIPRAAQVGRVPNMHAASRHPSPEKMLD